MCVFKTKPSFFSLICFFFSCFLSFQSSASEYRFISTSLASDEILFDLLSVDRIHELVGVSHLVDNPKYSNIAKKVQNFEFQRVSSKGVEGIVGLKPSHVFIASFNHPGLINKLKKFNINSVYLEEFSKMSDIESNIKKISVQTNTQKVSASILELFQSDLKETGNKLLAKKTFLLYLGDQSTAGKNTLFDDIISHIGGVNLASIAGVKGFSKISTEWLVQSQPDFVIYPSLNFDLKAATAQIKQTPGFKALQSQVIIVDQAKFWATSHYITGAVKQIVAKVCKVAKCRD